jgi:hypothetical protein
MKLKDTPTLAPYTTVSGIGFDAERAISAASGRGILSLTLARWPM